MDEIARRLGEEQPFYAMQARGIDGRQPPLRRVEDMAALYLDAMCAAQIKGPYMLGGFSGGGVIALEMAQRLRGAGEEVALLVLFDTTAPGVRISGSRPNGASSSRAGLTEHPTPLRRLQQILARSKGRLQWLWFRLPVKIANRWTRFRIWWHSVRSDCMPVELRDFQQSLSFLDAQRDYKPSAVYPGRAVLFRAADDAADTWIGDDYGWTPHIGGEFDVQLIPGKHVNLLQEPNIGVLVAELADAMDSGMQHHIRRSSTTSPQQSGNKRSGPRG